MKMIFTMRGNETILTVIFLLVNGHKVMLLDKVIAKDLKILQQGRLKLENAGCSFVCGKWQDEKGQEYLEIIIDGPQSEVFEDQIKQFERANRDIEKIENMAAVVKKIPIRALDKACKMAGIKRNPIDVKKNTYSTFEVIRP